MFLDEFSHVLSIIHEKNCWGNNLYDTLYKLNRPAIKYVNALFDSRDGRVYLIELRDILLPEGKVIDHLDFRVDNEDGKSKLYKYISNIK